MSTTPTFDPRPFRHRFIEIIAAHSPGLRPDAVFPLADRLSKAAVTIAGMLAERPYEPRTEREPEPDVVHWWEGPVPHYAHIGDGKSAGDPGTCARRPATGGWYVLGADRTPIAVCTRGGHPLYNPDGTPVTEPHRFPVSADAVRVGTLLLNPDSTVTWEAQP